MLELENKLFYKIKNSVDLFYKQPFNVREKYLKDLEDDLYKYAAAYINTCPKCFCENVRLCYSKRDRVFRHNKCGFYFNPRNFLTNKENQTAFQLYKCLNSLKQDHWMILY